MRAQAPINDESAQMVACLPRLRRYARALVGERSGADDLVQDTCERAWARLHTWRQGSDMRAWLFGIMHNLHVDQRRKPGLATTPIDDTGFEASTRATQADALEIRDLETALAQLPVEQREVLLLIALEDMSYEEVARTLGIPSGTVMSRLSRGREKLRAQMQGRPQVNSLKVVK
ncbi:RNA polymerase sigma factor [Paralcaligenes sp. KSB-10]|uniref:RNA polymerase sigma factor n=1 Tax=Paralcaligenes sp. KSB-10 TaxID=2901142 RepID=UPI001E631405|nr:RNA polymerase sigma factor [Paralcaligenes sp. KSB-10]UHL65088.1 RNA polymerase sigma factor [Paralcaligenes sp. KSB-10]